MPTSEIIKRWGAHERCGNLTDQRGQGNSAGQTPMSQKSSTSLPRSGSYIEVDGEALRYNLHTLQSVVGEGRAALVLKGNAYGHGYEQACSAFSHCRQLTACVHSIGEAHRLLQYSTWQRIIVMGGILPRDLRLQQLHPSVELTVGNFELLERCLQSDTRRNLHLKFDTGMGRQGFNITDLPLVLEKTAQHKNWIVGLSSHFANVEDVLEQSYAERQLALFDEVGAVFAGHGYEIERHIASRAAALVLPRSRFDFCRFGISLYGFWPSKLVQLSYFKLNTEMIRLRPALKWKTHLTTVKTLPADSFVGYGCTWKSPQAVKIAVLPVGYYDGYPRQAGNANSYVLIKGTRCAVLGRICMNMMIIDVSHLPAVKVGDPAVLIGQDGKAQVSAEQLAEWSGTIQYDIVSRINPNLERILV